MYTAIVYSTKYGCTEKCAKLLKEQFNNKVDLINLNNIKTVNLSKYDTVIIGGPIYIGKIRKEILKFSNKHLKDLTSKKIGLFICGMPQNGDYLTELNTNFPKILLDNALAKEYFGGEFIIDKLNFFERLLLKKVANVSTNKSNILIENIQRFAEKFVE